MEILKKVFEEWSQKLVTTISTLSIMMSASMDRLWPKDVNEGKTDLGQILSDKTEKVLKVELQMTGQENDLEKDTLLDIQKKLAEVLKIKREIQMINQENDLENVFLLDLQKRLVKTLKKSVQWDKEELKRNQIVWQYLIELNIKTVRSKRKEYNVGLFQQG